LKNVEFNFNRLKDIFPPNFKYEPVYKPEFLQNVNTLIQSGQAIINQGQARGGLGINDRVIRRRQLLDLTNINKKKLRFKNVPRNMNLIEVTKAIFSVTGKNPTVLKLLDRENGSYFFEFDSELGKEKFFLISLQSNFYLSYVSSQSFIYCIIKINKKFKVFKVFFNVPNGIYIIKYQKIGHW
jgi:hypothetical protein